MDKLMLSLLMGLAGYLSGSVMYAIVLTRRASGEDVRHFGDGNPGAFNVALASGLPLCVLCVFLEIGKGVLPVLVSRKLLGLQGWYLLFPLVCPVLGHIFPLFQGFRGGKAVCVQFGVWIGMIPECWLSLLWACWILVLLPWLHQDHRKLILTSLMGFLPSVMLLVWLTGQAYLVFPLLITTSLVAWKWKDA